MKKFLFVFAAAAAVGGAVVANHLYKRYIDEKEEVTIKPILPEEEQKEEVCNCECENKACACEPETCTCDVEECVCETEAKCECSEKELEAVEVQKAKRTRKSRKNTESVEATEAHEEQVVNATKVD